MNKVKLRFFAIAMIAFGMIYFSKNIYAQAVTVGIDTFPKSYQAYLLALVEKHPNWVFKALYTSLDFDYAVTQESVLSSRSNAKSISLSPLSWNRAWHHVFTNGIGNYNVTEGKLYQHEAGWVTSSVNAVKFTMDPRNFLNEETIFMFEDLKYDAKIHTLDGVEKILYGTEMSTYNVKDGTYTIKNIEYYDTSGNLKTYYYDADGDGVEDDTMTYAEAYILAAKESSVNPYSLVIRTKNETGCLITSNGQISGKCTNYQGYYNYYSIGAYGSNPMLNGVIYAKNRNWWNPVLAIVEGAKLVIGGDYVVRGQNTSYLTRFNVQPDAYYNSFTHQYMTDLTCVYRESFQMFDTYYSTGEINRAIEFLIPIYENMPEIPVDIYQDYSGQFETKNDTITLKNKTKLYSQIQVSSGMARIELMELPAGAKLKLLATSTSGMYDKVSYEYNGSLIAGYIFYNTAVTTNTKMVVADGISLNVRTSPRINGKYVRTINAGTIVTRVEKNSSTDSTGIWDKIILEDGTICYACRQYSDGTIYLKELEYMKVSSVTFTTNSITIGINATKQMQVNILPLDARFKGVSYISSDSSCVTVTTSGIIKGVKKGKATITVTTDDMQYTATCEVEVKPNIVTDKNDYEIKVGEAVTPEVTVNGIDEYTLEYISSDEKIVSIVENKLYGIVEGTAIVNIYAEPKGDVENKIYTTINVQVTKSQEVVIEEKFELNKSITKKEDNTISGFDENMTVSGLKKLITSNMKYTILDMNNKEKNEIDVIGTGTTIEVENAQGEKITYTIKIYGDVDGDGAISSKDYIAVKNHIMETIRVNGVQFDAADVNKDDMVNSKDYIAIKNHIMETSLIVQ